MIKAKKSLGIVFFPAFDWAISPTHPERQERLLYTQDQLREEGIFDIDGIKEYKPGIATIEDIERVHFCFPDAPHVTTRSHLISAGGAIKAAETVMTGERESAFAMVRPPGHHAMKVVHGSRGFCSINIEAVMIEHIREHYGHKRIAIIDTDCHHGDGTQDVYWHDPDTLFISIHQDGRTLYPGTGFPHDLGGPHARGRTLNIPLPPQTSDSGFLAVIEHIVMPILKDFQPDLIINSAGQDNHFSDPITDMNFSARGYAQLNEMLKPDIAVLEGGYSIQGALPYVNLGICLAMAGVDYSHVREPNFNERQLEQDQRTTDYIEELCLQLPQLYFTPPTIKFDSESKDGIIKDGTFIRQKQIYYDTDGIHEIQREKLTLCNNCRGLLSIETRADSGPLSLGIEIPSDACPCCLSKGLQLMDIAQRSGHYRFMQLINRPEKNILRYGF